MHLDYAMNVPVGWHGTCMLVSGIGLACGSASRTGTRQAQIVGTNQDPCPLYGDHVRHERRGGFGYHVSPLESVGEGRAKRPRAEANVDRGSLGCQSKRSPRGEPVRGSTPDSWTSLFLAFFQAGMELAIARGRSFLSGYSIRPAPHCLTILIRTPAPGLGRPL